MRRKSTVAQVQVCPGCKNPRGRLYRHVVPMPVLLCCLQLRHCLCLSLFVRLFVCGLLCASLMCLPSSDFVKIFVPVVCLQVLSFSCCFREISYALVDQTSGVVVGVTVLLFLVWFGWEERLRPPDKVAEAQSLSRHLPDADVDVRKVRAQLLDALRALRKPGEAVKLLVRSLSGVLPRSGAAA